MTPSLEELIRAFKLLPGVGRKTAVRYAHTLLGHPEAMELLISTLLRVREKVRLCPSCFFLTEDPLCQFCKERQGSRALCVVAYPMDVLAIERTSAYRGRYHVLHGLLDPLRGVTLEKLKVRELITRIEEESLEEILFALSPTQEGETTARLIATLISRFPVRITRLAYGIPLGSQLDFLDEATLSLALKHRGPFFPEPSSGSPPSSIPEVVP
jgi:recombination protein RecR